MTPLEEFYRTCRLEGLGDRFYPIPPGQAEAFQLCRVAFDGWVRAVRGRALPGRSLPDIHLDFLKSGTFNGMACLIDKAAFIGLARGSLLLTYDLFHRMLAHPDVLPSVGDPSKESINYQHNEGVVDDYDDLLLPRIGAGLPADTILPRCPIRFEFATFAGKIAVDFLIAHEIAHVSNGHLESSTAPQPFITERALAHGLSVQDSLRSQALEFDADCAAVTRCLDRLMNFADSVKDGGPIFDAVFGSREKQFLLWVFAIAGLFHLWGMKINLADLHGTHPPTAMRYQYSLATAYTLVDAKAEPGLVEIFGRADLAAYGQLMHALRRIGCVTVNAQWLSFRTAMTDPAVLAHTNAIRRAWNAIRDHLEKFACLRVAPADGDITMEGWKGKQ